MPVKIFFCYAHEDVELLTKLKAHLKPLQMQGTIDVWYDRDISPGTEWEKEIHKHLNEAHIILLLISPGFMSSDYCYGKELKHAILRHERQEARVIPIILDHVDWQIEPLTRLQALPTDAKPVMSKDWHSLNEALYDVVKHIRKVAEEKNWKQSGLMADIKQEESPVQLLASLEGNNRLVDTEGIPYRAKAPEKISSIPNTIDNSSKVLEISQVPTAGMQKIPEPAPNASVLEISQVPTAGMQKIPEPMPNASVLEISQIPTTRIQKIPEPAPSAPVLEISQIPTARIQKIPEETFGTQSTVGGLQKHINQPQEANKIPKRPAAKVQQTSSTLNAVNSQQKGTSQPLPALEIVHVPNTKTGWVLQERYLLQRLIKQTPFCSVYQGTDQRLQRTVAVKSVIASHIAEYRASMQLTAKFSHQHIPDLYDLIIEPEDFYIVQEFVEGDSFEMLVRAQLSDFEIAEAGRQMCLALMYAGSSSRRVCHGNITPPSIIRNSQGVIKINNFALPVNMAYFEHWSAMGGDRIALLETDLPWGQPSENRKADDTRAVALLLYQLLVGSQKPSTDGRLRFQRGTSPELCETLARAIVRQHPQNITTPAALYTYLKWLSETLEPL